jgi:hypothetical protein
MLLLQKRTQQSVQRTGLRPGGTGRACWQWLWFAMEFLPVRPAANANRSAAGIAITVF